MPSAAAAAITTEQASVTAMSAAYSNEKHQY
jgi:hypothetical protein